ncbi:MAG: ABC transporter permease [Candidatus Omnitrophica bacterium]|nr:ABC transporter permease [Candidatus Omnitrophota bacterium]
MKISKEIILSLEILTEHKVRTFLSLLGMVVGVGAVVVMVSTGRSAQKQIVDRINRMGTNLVIVSAGKSMLIAGRQRQMNIVRTLQVADAQSILEECPSVALAAPAVSEKVNIRWEDQNVNTTVAGMSVDGFQIRGIKPQSGRIFDPEESRALKRVAVVGSTAAANLFGSADPVGQQIRIGKVLFEVIGKATPRGTDVNGLDQDDVIFVPLETAMRRILNVTYVQTIYVQARNSRLLKNAEEEIASLLRERHRLAAKPDDFTIQNQATLLEAERETTSSMTLLVGSVAAISLIVGGVGILAVMLMSVRERIREIGLRRALGALRRDIRNQFLVESAILAGVGGMAGIGGGAILSWAISRFAHWPPVISLDAAAVAFSFSVVIGVFFGLYPAIKAANLDPIQALRSE